MSPKKNCKPDLLTLYSSNKFTSGSKSDSKEICIWKLDNTLKLLIKFVSKYKEDYFRASFDL